MDYLQDEDVFQAAKEHDLMASLYIVGQGSEKSLPGTTKLLSWQPLNVSGKSDFGLTIVIPQDYGYVIMSQSYRHSWVMDGERAIANLGVTNAFSVKWSGAHDISNKGVRELLPFYLISAVTILTLLAYLVFYQRANRN